MAVLNLLNKNAKERWVGMAITLTTLFVPLCFFVFPKKTERVFYDCKSFLYFI